MYADGRSKAYRHSVNERNNERANAISKLAYTLALDDGITDFYDNEQCNKATRLMYRERARAQLILEGMPSPAPAAPPPFVLTDDSRVLKTTTTMTRPRQSGFRAQVLGHYGCNCAVCDVVIEEVIEAAHLCPKSADGSDHVGNGLPLCRTHHKAMDAGLFAISPALDVVLHPDRDLTSLGITRPDIRHLPNAPNPIALAWLWAEFCPNVHQSENNS